MSSQRRTNDQLAPSLSSTRPSLRNGGSSKPNIRESADHLFKSSKPNSSHGSLSKSFVPKATIQGKAQKLGDGVPGFKTSFDVSGKSGGAFRPITESFSVNPSNGTMSLSVPLSASATRGDFGPKLNLSYDSGSGNGVFGFGWGVSLPSFRLKTSQGIPQYTGQDCILFSGADIVTCLDKDGHPQTKTINNFLVTSYRPRVDSKSIRIEKWTKPETGDVHWRTISGDNVTSIFGDNGDTRIMDQSTSAPRVYSWLISRSFDSHGNALEYIYEREDGNGLADNDKILPIWEKERSNYTQKYLKRINYGNRVSNRDLDSGEISAWPQDWMFELVFDYGEHNHDSPSTSASSTWPIRQDVFSQNHAGFEIRTYRLCRRVLMFHHFPRELGTPETLVSSQTFLYDESPQRTVLDSITFSRHSLLKESLKDNKLLYKTESLPPWSFHYTSVPDFADMETLNVNVANLVHPPSRDSVSEWLDLDGEGLPGLLHRLPDGTLTYQRNPGPDADDVPHFRSPVVLDQQPAIVGKSLAGSFLDLDRTGHLNMICRNFGGQPIGFYEREDSDTWSNYSDFSSVPNTDDSSETSLSIDLVGDGTSDLLSEVSNSRQVVWKQSLGKSGSSESKRTFHSTKGEPLHLVNNADIQTYVADMSGDGLSDIVQISKNKIIYWSNQGHGVFSSSITMGNPPSLEEFGVFEHSRIRLIDVDGSGTTDLIYLLPMGGAKLFYNLAGNSWSEPVQITGLPKISSPSSIFTLDLKGSGTACLCWLEDHNSPNMTEIHYLDLMAGVKPHLLDSFSNGLGATTTVTYTPSTKFYLGDQLSSQPWTTKLSFPVQLISRTVLEDKISGNIATTDYQYHNGCYDPIEKQFAGFEMVETRAREEVLLGPSETYESYPVVTKSWFNVGLHLDIDQSRFFSSSQVSSFQESMNDKDAIQACFALRGSKMRTEVYCNDGTETACVPHSVDEFSYDIRQVQISGPNKYPVVQMHPRAYLSTQYERSLEDPRVSHEIVLKADNFGNIEESVDIVYPRRAGPAASVGYQDVTDNQLAGNVQFNRSWFTNSVEYEKEAYRTPALWRHQDYEVLNFPFSGLVDIEQVRKFNFDNLQDIKSSSSWKYLRSEERVYFQSSDMTTRLPGGRLEVMSLVDQAFSLAFTSSTLEKIKSGRKSCEIEFKRIPKPSEDSAESLEEALKRGGYVQVAKESDENWWAPTSRFAFSRSGNASDQLRAALNSFFVPTVSEDVFGNQSCVSFDEDFLLVKETEDAIGNTFKFENDYEHLQPFKITDPNWNITEVLIDAMGRTVASAAVGKNDQSLETDSLQGLQEDVQKYDTDLILSDPNGDTARKLLGNANVRIIHCLDRFHQWSQNQSGQNHGKRGGRPEADASSSPEAAFLISISRDLSFRQSNDPTLLVEVTYFNGSGQPIQTATLNDPLDPTKTWLVSGRTASTSSGAGATRAYKPFFAWTPALVPVSKINSNAATNFHDALGRTVASLTPDHAWSKTLHTPWSQIEYTSGDLVLSSPQADPDIANLLRKINPSLYLPTWYEMHKSGTTQQQHAAAKSLVYQNAPTVTHFGSCGLVVRQVHTVGDVVNTRAYTYDYSGNQIHDKDSRHRTVEQRCYDKLNRCLGSSGMDSGEAWCLQDALGGVLYAWNSRGLCFQYMYDKLRRQLQQWIHTAAGSPKLIIKTEYGESNRDDAVSKNLKGQVWKIFDQSGIYSNIRFDIRGHCTETAFNPAKKYKEILDWSNENLLEDETFTHSSTFNSLGHLIEEEDNEGNCTRTEHSRLDQVVSVTSRRAGAKAWDNHLVSASFTEDDLPLKTVYGNGVSVELSYDSKSRHLISQRTTRTPQGKETDFEDFVSPRSSRQLVATEKLRRSKKTQRSKTTVMEDLSFTYDICGRKVLTSDGSEQTKYFRDTVIPAKWEYTHDGMGQLISARGRARLPSSGGRDVQLTPYNATTGMAPNQGVLDGEKLYEYLESYTYDLAGNMKTMKHEAPKDSLVRGWTRHYFYEEPSLLSDDPDVKGNRLSRTKVGATEEKYAYQGDEANGYKYDYLGDAGKIGCMTKLPQYSRLTWNISNMMASSSTQLLGEGIPRTTYYVYNHAGTRVRKITESVSSSSSEPRVERNTFYLDGLEIQQKFSTNKPVSTRKIAHVNGAELLALIETTENEEHSDDDVDPTAPLIRYQIGSGMELDDHGRLISYEEYSPFGMPVYSAARNSIEAPRLYRFAKYEHDRETGLYHCQARYYCPWLGRWTSPDPLGTADGPNIQSYCGNDPVNWTDPEGTSKQEGTRSVKGSNALRSLIPSCFKSKNKKSDLEVHKSEGTGKRRGASADVREHIKTSADAKAFNEAQKQAVERINGRIKTAFNKAGGTRGVIFETVKVVGGEVLGFVPVVGSVLKPVFKAGIDIPLNKHLAALSNQEDADKYEFAHETGARAMNKKWMDAMREISNMQDGQAKSEAIDALSLYGPGGRPEMRRTNIPSVDEDRQEDVKVDDLDNVPSTDGIQPASRPFTKQNIRPTKITEQETDTVFSYGNDTRSQKFERGEMHVFVSVLTRKTK